MATKGTEMSDRAILLGRSLRSDEPGASSASIEAVREQVDGVADIMRDNMHQMLERDEALSSLAKKSEATARSAGAFHVRARGARRGMQLDVCKTNAILAALVLLALFLLTWWFDFLGGGDPDATDPPPAAAPPAASGNLLRTSAH
eukprot:scaffold5675_cov107-Isochrysis_galbana.AAC.1